MRCNKPNMFEFYQSQNLVSQYLKLIYHREENPQHGSEIKERDCTVKMCFGKHILVVARVHGCTCSGPTQ